MPPRIPRIVILDNDQTTGDYIVLFYWLDWLKKSDLQKYVTLKSLIQPFSRICEDAHIFRPGLRPMIRRILEMRDEGEVDYVVVYTNQSEPEPLMLGKDGDAITIPRLLEAFYNHLADGETLIDLTLVRPHEYDYIPTFVPKQFSRVFSELGLPRRYWNARYTKFFDDAPEKFIQDNDVLGAGRAHIRVEAYYACIDTSILLELCLETLKIADQNGAKKGELTLAIRNIHDLLLKYRQEEMQSCRPAGRGLGRYLDFLNLDY
jgi:hypothetical protein